MGFLDKLDNLLDKADKYLANMEEQERLKSRKQYDIFELVTYFDDEIEGKTNRTTIHKLITGRIQELNPKANKWEWILKISF